MVYSKSIDQLEIPLKRTLKGLVRLTRFREYGYFVVFTTLMGVAAARGTFNWRLIVLMMANWLVVGFAFMINDIEDAPDDALMTVKTKHNPVSSGLISPKTARYATFFIGLISVGLCAILGLWPLVFGMANLIFGYLYSIKTVRLKSMAFFDIISYSLMLAGLPFLSGYFTFASRFNRMWIWPFVFVVSICIYSELYSKIRELECERPAQHQHTATVLGDRAANVLLIVMMVLSVSMGAVTFFLINMIPPWVMILMAFFAILFIMPSFLRNRRSNGKKMIQGSWQKPLERAAALALALQFMIPWLVKLF
jgi:4-hydroxybenzoate polyprenyltransferase